jgi:hypothetical protein
MPAECSIRVTNVDAGRGKGVTAVGSITGTRVLPKQTYTFINENGTWQQDPVFQVVSTNPQVYVNFIEGSDDPTISDCLAPGAGACKTFQAAINIGRFNYWPVGINIQADCESQYDQSLQIVGITYLVTIIGNESNPSACQFNRTVSTVIFNVQDYAILAIAGFSVSSPVPTTFFVARQHVIIDIQNMIFGPNAGGSAIQAFANSVVNLTGTITLNSAHGGMTLIGAGANSRVTTNATFLVPAGQQAGYSVWFSAIQAGMIDANPGFPIYNLDARSTVTGQSYNCSVNAGIQLSTPYPPGLSPGLAITGCQAAPP